MWLNKDFTVYIWSDKGEFYLKQSKVILQKITAGHHISFVYLAYKIGCARAMDFPREKTSTSRLNILDKSCIIPQLLSSALSR